jgi:uncharacterized protein (DUF983 family)
MSLIRVVSGVFGNTCPRCSEGKVYAGLLKMNETCPKCSLKFEREQGYFTGAMAISYTIGFFAILPPLLLLLIMDAPAWMIVVLPGIELTILAPFTARWARLAWLYIDHKVES